MNAPLPASLVRPVPQQAPAGPLSEADQYQLDAIAAAASDAMDPDYEPAEDLG